jgi:hypothetical protein
VSPVKYEWGVKIPEEGILHSHSCENVKSYKIEISFAAKEFSTFVDFSRLYLAHAFASTIKDYTFYPQT